MAKTKKVFLGIGVIAAIAVITFAFAIAASGSDGGVIDQNAEGVTVAASAVTSSISYQGRLADSEGEPLSGTYDMTFRLYNVSSGGTVLDTDTHSVEVTDGLFNTDIGFDQNYFDGRELWSGIIVEGEVMTPRQEFKPVPYALSLRPGAVINGSVSGPVLEVKNVGDGGSGVRAYSDKGYGVYGSGYKGGGYFVQIPAIPEPWFAIQSEPWLAIESDGKNAGVFGVGKYGGYFTTIPVLPGDGHTAGVNATTIYDNSDGVQAHTTGDYSIGVRVSTRGNSSDGVSAYSDKGYGVRGSGSKGGGYFTQVQPGMGSFWREKNAGVFGAGKYGGYFTATQAGTSWDDRTAGVNVSTAHLYSDGVHASTTGWYSPGVYASTTGAICTGVYASTTGVASDGVYAHTTGVESRGVSAYSAKSHGVDACTDSADHAGVYAMGKDSGADLILGGNADTAVGDDGRIYSDPNYPGSDIFLITNDGVRIDLDNNGDGEDADFEIRDKDNKLIFNVDESGDMSASGDKAAVVTTKDYGTRKMYALESTEVWFEDFGTAQLQDGVAVVEIDPVFAATVNLSVAYHVFFTPVDGWAPIYVANKTPTSFEVRDANDEADITLEYRIVAKRLGYEDVRMEQVEFGNEEA